MRLNKLLKWTICFIFLDGLLITPLFAENEIIQLRSNSLANKVQVVVDLSEKPSFQAFSLVEPNRLVVDIKAKASVGYKNLLSFKNRGLTLVRTGARSENEVRIVLDLKEDFKWEVSHAPAAKKRGNRVVIDIFDQEPNSISTAIKTPLPKITLESIEVASNQNTAKSKSKVTQKSEQSAAVTKQPKQPSPAAAKQPKPKQPKIVATINKPAKPKKISSDTSKTATVTTKSRPSAAQNHAKDIMIMIDPGHGGKDSGAVGPSKAKEKILVLQISKRLKRKIDAMPGMRAVISRPTDRYISLRGRLKLARKKKADLFISIHADAFTRPDASGSSVFILSTRGASSEAAKWLANRENSVDLKYGVDIGDYDKDISDVLVKIQQDATIESSYVLAKKVLSELKKIGKLHKRHVERAGFAVLKSPDIPSILVETAFISNPKEEARLKSSAYQEKLAKAIAKGIEKYFDEHLPHHLLLINSP